MSFHKQPRSLPERFRLVPASFLQRPGLPFADALLEDAIQKAVDDGDVGLADDQNVVFTHQRLFRGLFCHKCCSKMSKDLRRPPSADGPGGCMDHRKFAGDYLAR